MNILQEQKDAAWFPCWSFLCPYFNATDALFISWLIQLARKRSKFDKQEKNKKREIDKGWIYVDSRKAIYDLFFLNPESYKKMITRLKEGGFIKTKRALRTIKKSPEPVLVTYINIILPELSKRCNLERDNRIEKSASKYDVYHKTQMFMAKMPFVRIFYHMSYRFESAAELLLYHWLINRSQIKGWKDPMNVPPAMIVNYLGIDVRVQRKILKNLESSKWIFMKVVYAGKDKRVRYIQLKQKKLNRELEESLNSDNHPSHKQEFESGETITLKELKKMKSAD